METYTTVHQACGTAQLGPAHPCSRSRQEDEVAIGTVPDDASLVMTHENERQGRLGQISPSQEPAASVHIINNAQLFSVRAAVEQVRSPFSGEMSHPRWRPCPEDPATAPHCSRAL